MSRAFAIFLLTLLMPAIAAAQETVELTETQRSFNEKGVNAIRDKNYPLAISSFESSLQFGPSANVIHLNLGRAHQRDGNCMEAKASYAKVADAPAVESPSRDEILKVLAKYSGELPELCPATVKVLCADPDATVSLDGGEPQPCSPSAALEVAPGEHELTATLGDRTLDQSVSPAEGEVVEVAIVFPTDRVKPDPDPDPQPDSNPDPGLVAKAPTGRSPLRTIGLVTGAVGAATLTAAFISDYTLVRSAVKDCKPVQVDGVDMANPNCTSDGYTTAQRRKTANGVVFAVGGGLAIGGLILYLAGAPSDTGVSLQFNGGPGIAWTTRF